MNKNIFKWKRHVDETDMEGYELIHDVTGETIAIIVPKDIDIPLGKGKNGELYLRKKEFRDWEQPRVFFS